MFLSCWFFGLRHDSLEPLCCLVGPGLGAKWGPMGRQPINILWGFLHQCPCPLTVSYSQTPPPRPLVRSSPSSWRGTAVLVPSACETLLLQPAREKFLFLPALWSSCMQAHSGLKAKYSEGFSIPDPHTALEGCFLYRNVLCSLCVFYIF